MLCLRFLFGSVHFALLSSGVHSQDLLEVGTVYRNPIVQEPKADLGDPGALYIDGFYYLATSSGNNPNAFPIHRSADLATWELVGPVFPDWKGKTAPTWAQGDFWAPDLQTVNGHIACYFSARAPGGLFGNGILSLGVAFSGNITGPFRDIGHPLWEDRSNTFGTIDVHFHQTPQGEKYLVWKKNQNVPHLELSAHLMMQRLADDGASFGTDPAFAIATTDQPWEKWGCIEAPWLLERNDMFYLFYSASMVNYDSYAVGVARSQNVTGPYAKKKGPVIHNCAYTPPTETPRFLQEGLLAASTLYTAEPWTPGHCSVLPVAGQEDRWVMFYHGRDVNNKTDTNYRAIMMDELKWGADGWPYVDGDCPSSTVKPVP